MLRGERGELLAASPVHFSQTGLELAIATVWAEAPGAAVDETG